MSARARDPLSIIRALRADGAVEVEVDGIKARFAGPPAVAKPPASVEELHEQARRSARRERSDEDRLLRPLGILTDEGKEPAA